MSTIANPTSHDIAGAMQADRLRRSDVSAAINKHLAAVHADEAMFDDNGVALDEKGATETQKTEIKAYDAFLRAPCVNAEDVQAKIRYLIYGTVGERYDLISCIDDGEYGFGLDMEGVRILLASMLLDDNVMANLATTSDFRPSGQVGHSIQATDKLSAASRAPGATRAREDNSHTHAREGL